MKRNRLGYLVITIVIVVLGSASRRFSAMLPSILADFAGDTLWALMVFVGIGLLAAKSSTNRVALAALTVCYAVELTQLYHASWIDNICNTRLGGLALGYGFLWSDIVCYTVGVALGVVMEIGLGKIVRQPLLAMLVLAGCSRDTTVWNGVYTAEQAARGRSVYQDHCVLCHKPDLTGLNGRLKGKRFMEEWREDNLRSLFTQTKRDMPGENPGTLTDVEYLHVLTYILQENGFPQGRQELRFEALESIAIVSREGPKPLPAGAVIQTFGCLRRDTATENWTLSNAAPFTRGRNREALSPEELNRLDQQRPGSQTVELNTAFFRRFAGKQLDLTHHIGRKVLVRGRLENATGIPRVMLVAVQAMDSSCRSGT